MKWKHSISVVLAALAALGAIPPAMASSFARASLDQLVAGNETIVVGEAVEARSYWNADHSFILTDVRVAVDQVLKGSAPTEIVVTLPGGTVGELTSAIVGGVELAPGRSYLLFLDRARLLGAENVLMVRDHGQGAFDLELKDGEVRAISQAWRHELAADGSGRKDPVGGAAGLPLARLTAEVRTLAEKIGQESEVER